MPDFKKTQKIYEEQGISHLWKQPLELLDDELFEAKVLNPDTKTYNQVSDLQSCNVYIFRKDISLATVPALTFNIVAISLSVLPCEDSSIHELFSIRFVPFLVAFGVGVAARLLC
ncbi:MAG: hypothetical protein WBV72_06050, partial [Nitrososphaeraceae archaeon]